MKKYRNALLLFGLWVNAYAAGLERAQGLTWKALLLCAFSAMYVLALLEAWERKESSTNGRGTGG